MDLENNLHRMSVNVVPHSTRLGTPPDFGVMISQEYLSYGNRFTYHIISWIAQMPVRNIASTPNGMNSPSGISETPV